MLFRFKLDSTCGSIELSLQVGVTFDWSRSWHRVHRAINCGDVAAVDDRLRTVWLAALWTFLKQSLNWVLLLISIIVAELWIVFS